MRLAVNVKRVKQQQGVSAKPAGLQQVPVKLAGRRSK
jgi:hypothetical protein